jgi:hypothetical protein
MREKGGCCCWAGMCGRVYSADKITSNNAVYGKKVLRASTFLDPLKNFTENREPMAW